MMWARACVRSVAAVLAAAIFCLAASGISTAESASGATAPAPNWTAHWISSDAAPENVWRDATYQWDFTLRGSAAAFLFRATPDGKRYGNAYAWRVVSEHGGAHLDLMSRRYNTVTQQVVGEVVVRTIALPPITPGSRHTLSVEARGSALTTSFDGARIDHLETQDHQEGTTGVFVPTGSALVLHRLTITPQEERPLVEDFRNNDTRMSAGVVTPDGLLIADTAANMDVVLPIARPAALLRRDFEVRSRIVSATLYVAAGGFPRIEINGRQINEAIGDGFTAYDRRVLYRRFDVTRYVRPGANAIGAELGRGWYALSEPNEWFWHAAPWHQGVPAVRLQLELQLADGTKQIVGTDEAWRWIDGPTRHDSIYAGERYDARALPSNWSSAHFDATAWLPAHLVQGPTGRLDAAAQEPIAVTEQIQPVALTQPAPGVWVFDFGRVFAGRVRLHVRGPAGQTISLVKHEQLRADGTVNVFDQLVDTQIQTDRYILSGKGDEVWAPQFSYAGFRYVEVRGFPGTPRLSNLVGEVMHSNVASVATFESSNPLLNQIQDAARRTILNNMHGFQTDTPTFEKNGWTGDAQASALASALNFDVTRVWTKWMADFRDAQAPSGEIPEIVPSTPLYGYENTPGWNMIGGPTPSWDAATLIIPDDLYQLTGNRQLLAQMYDTQKRLVDYTGRFFTAEFVYANPNNMFLGEYAMYKPPGAAFAVSASRPAVDAVSTAYYFHMTDLLAQNARVLGRDQDAGRYTALAGKIRDAFNARYFDGARYRLAGHAQFLQFMNVLPVAFGMAPEAKRAVIMRQVSDDLAANNYRLTTTGVFSGRYILLLLSDYGFGETAYRVATQTEMPSWGFWLAHGVNTMQEDWAPDSRSRDHHYWGSISSWFYQGLAGIRPGAPGYERIVIRPVAPAALHAASASIDTVRGRISSSWRREGAAMNLSVTVPIGVGAEVWCPGTQPSAAPSGALRLREEQGYTVYAINGGRHRCACH